MTRNEAFQLLPTDAKWSSSFGNPGEGGYVEYYRTLDGERWSVTRLATTGRPLYAVRGRFEKSAATRPFLPSRQAAREWIDFELVTSGCE